MRTSVSETSHVVSRLVWQKIFRSCFFCTIVKLTNVLTNDEVVALTCDFFGALEVAGLVQSNLYVFECVTSKIHSFDRVLRCVTLPINFTRIQEVKKAITNQNLGFIEIR